jgi:hypothetical protein
MDKSEILSVNEDKKELGIREEEVRGEGDQIQHIDLLNEDKEDNQLNNMKDAEEIRIIEDKNELNEQYINSNIKDQNSPHSHYSPDEHEEPHSNNVDNNNELLNQDKSQLSNINQENIQDNNIDKLYIIQLEQKIKELNSR